MSNVFGITAYAYRWYADDGSESASTALAAENTSLAISNLADFPIVLRYGVQESGAGSAAGASTDDYQLQYSLNGGAFTNVTAASSVVQGYTSSNLTDAAATTSRLSAGTGSFVAGEIAETDGLLTDWALTANNYSDLVFAIQILAAGTADGDSITFRVLRNGAVFTAYSITPALTIQNVYTHTADPGAVAITGTAATLKRILTLTAAAGSVAITGTDATLAKRVTMTADAGAVAITGTDASLERGLEVAADSGSVPITGTAATMYRRITLDATSGNVPITGTAAALLYHRELAAESGNVPITGTAADLERGLEVNAEAGNVPITGTDATLTYAPNGGYTLTAEAGAVPIAGTAAALLYMRALAAAAGSIPITGNDATLELTRSLAASAGNVPITGTDAAMFRRLRLTAEVGAVPITGTDATLSRIELGEGVTPIHLDPAPPVRSVEVSYTRASSWGSTRGEFFGLGRRRVRPRGGT